MSFRCHYLVWCGILHFPIRSYTNIINSLQVSGKIFRHFLLKKVETPFLLKQCVFKFAQNRCYSTDCSACNCLNLSPSVYFFWRGNCFTTCLIDITSILTFSTAFFCSSDHFPFIILFMLRYWIWKNQNDLTNDYMKIEFIISCPVLGEVLLSGTWKLTHVPRIVHTKWYRNRNLIHKHDDLWFSILTNHSNLCILSFSLLNF